jgi:hypothetical protein
VFSHAGSSRTGVQRRPERDPDQSGRAGQVVYKGGYYFAWKRGHFIGTYETLDDAVESLTFRPTKKAH